MNESIGLGEKIVDGKYWRCHSCGHILATFIGGMCTIIHPVKVTDWNAPILVCPVCGKEVKWYYMVKDETYRSVKG